MRQKLTEGKIGPILVKLTVPTVLGLFTMLGFIIIDTLNIPDPINCSILTFMICSY